MLSQPDTARMNMRDKQGASALDTAISHQRPKAAQLLRELGAAFNGSVLQADFIDATQGGSVQQMAKVSSCKRRGSVTQVLDAIDGRGRSALMLAAAEGDLRKVVRDLRHVAIAAPTG